MKKSLLLSFAFVVLASGVFGQAINVPKSKKALLIKATATWCGPCGFYHPITDNIYHQHSDSILFINDHVKTSDVGDAYSGDFHNALDADPGIPGYSISGTCITNWPPVEKVMVDSARKFLKRPVIANIAFTYQITGNQLAVQTSVKFFAADKADEYYVNVFMLENKIATIQKVDETMTPLVQDRVSRGPMMSGNSGMWGQKFATGSVASGAFYDVNFTATLAPTWVKANMQFVAVVWKKTTVAGATKPTYVALSAEDVPASTTGIANVNSPSSDALIVYPNPVTTQMNIPVNGAGNVSVFNALGQIALYKDFEATSEHIITMNTAELKPGIYFIKMIQDGKMSTQKIIVQASKF